MRKIFFPLILFAASFLHAQTKAKPDKIFNSDDSTALLTVAAYPDSVRTQILQACQKPEILIKAEALQKGTSQSFRELVSPYSKEEQQKIWDLSRHPDLISKMIVGGKKSKEELEKLASAYPEEKRQTIIDYGRRHYDLLSSINTLQTNSQKEFEKIIAEYPSQTQSAYRSLLNRPEALNTLATNMHLSVMLGDMYKTNPQQTTHILDSVHTEQTKQSAKDLEDWKNGLEKNPAAKKELESAAKEFTKEHTDDDIYTDDVYKTGPSGKINAPVYNSTPSVASVNYIAPYPYWFGYPYWYDYPYWYPYPYWYNVGFYWGPGGMVYTGFPSPYFMHWYFFHPYHNYYYSNFSDYALGYNYSHYGPRYQRTGFNSEITRWSRANEPNLPKGYLNPSPERAGRIKELGKFEMDYHNNTKGVFGRNLTRTEFLQNNSNYYPHINPAINQSRFNQPINYPQQQNPVRFNMGGSGAPRPHMPSGGGMRGGRR